MKRIIEFAGMVGNHNLYSEDKLVIDWEKMCEDKGLQGGDIVVLCSSTENNLTMHWIDLPTQKEINFLHGFL